MKTTTHCIRTILASTFLLASLWSGAAARQKPNIVLFFVDDLGWS